MALPIFPGRRQPSIVGRNELNFRVRDGNGWTLALISTNSISSRSGLRRLVRICTLYGFSRALSSTLYRKERIALRFAGDPYRIRTDVKGVRGLCLNHLTNGPSSAWTPYRFFRHTALRLCAESALPPSRLLFASQTLRWFAPRVYDGFSVDCVSIAVYSFGTPSVGAL